MNILLNGETQTTELTKLEDILSSFVNSDNPFAIAVNENFVPKVNYAETIISEGDSIEVLSPMQGG